MIGIRIISSIGMVGNFAFQHPAVQRLEGHGKKPQSADSSKFPVV